MNLQDLEKAEKLNCLQAIEQARKGEIITRVPFVLMGSNYLFLRPETSFNISEIENIKTMPESVKNQLLEYFNHISRIHIKIEDKKIHFAEYFCIKTQNDYILPYSLTLEDLNANDWIVVKS